VLLRDGEPDKCTSQPCRKNEKEVSGFLNLLLSIAPPRHIRDALMQLLKTKETCLHIQSLTGNSNYE
jgi:hypothetical protein